jgi:DNA-binding MarR family transcriptional regulator
MTMSAEDAAIASGLESLYEVLRRLTPRSGLSLTAASTLWRLSHRGPQRLCDLNGPEGISQPAMTQLVTRMQREGLAKRGSDPADGRAVVVSVTERGRAAVAARQEGRAQALAGLLEGLSEEEYASVVAALPALEKLVELAKTDATP